MTTAQGMHLLSILNSSKESPDPKVSFSWYNSFIIKYIHYSILLYVSHPHLHGVISVPCKNNQSLALKEKSGFLTFILESINIDGVVLVRSEAPLHVTQGVDHSRLLLGLLLSLLLHNKPGRGRDDETELIASILTSFLELSAWSRLSLSSGTSSWPWTCQPSAPGISSWSEPSRWWRGSAVSGPRMFSACSGSTWPVRTSTLNMKNNDSIADIKTG